MVQPLAPGAASSPRGVSETAASYAAPAAGKPVKNDAAMVGLTARGGSDAAADGRSRRQRSSARQCAGAQDAAPPSPAMSIGAVTPMPTDVDSEPTDVPANRVAFTATLSAMSIDAFDDHARNEFAASVETSLSVPRDDVRVTGALVAIVAGDRSQADVDNTDTTAALIANNTATSDDPKAPHDNAAGQDAAPPSPGMSASVAGDRSQDDTDSTAAASIADDTAKSDDPKAPHDSAAVQDAAPPSPGISASVANNQSQADGDDTDTAAALIIDNTAKPDDPKALHDGAAALEVAPPREASKFGWSSPRTMARRT